MPKKALWTNLVFNREIILFFSIITVIAVSINVTANTTQKTAVGLCVTA